MMSLKLEKAIGANTDFLTAQSFILEIPSSTPNNSDHLLFVVSATGEDIFNQVKQVGNRLEEFWENIDGDSSAKLESLLKTLKEQLQTVENLQILLALLKDNVLYLIREGGGQVLLQRDDQSSSLTTSLVDDQLISGFIQEGDQILFTSAIEEKNQSLLDKLLTSGVDGIKEEIENYILSVSHPDPLAVILANLQPVEKEAPSLKEISGVRTVRAPQIKISIQWKKFFASLGKFIVQLFSGGKKRQILTAFIIVAILAVIFWQLSHFFRNKTQNDQFNTFYNTSASLLDKAQKEKDTSPDQAAKDLTQAKAAFTQASNLNPKDSKLKRLKENLDTSSSQILKIYPVNDWPVFLSLDLIDKDFTTTRVVGSVDELLLLSDKQKSLVLIDIDQKTNQRLAGVDKLGKESIFTALHGDYAFVFNPAKGIYRVDTTDSKVELPIPLSSQWGIVTDMYTFGGNVYLLDTSHNQIWKYIATETGYSEINSYLRDDQSADFNNATKMEIDSSIWVLNNKKITKFSSGVADSFQLDKVEDQEVNVDNFYISDEVNNLYVLDQTNSRLIIFNKEGKYQSQLVGDKFKTATDLEVDEKRKKIFLLTENKIYQVDLK